MQQLKKIIDEKIRNSHTPFLLDSKELTYNLRIGGGFYAMRELNELFRKYNEKIFAYKKWKAFQKYLNNQHFSLAEYEKRYGKKRKWIGKNLD